MKTILVKEVCKKRNVKLKELALKLDLKPHSFSISLQNLTMKRLEKIATILNVDVHELIAPPDGYVHLYDKENNWFGIHKV